MICDRPSGTNHALRAKASRRRYWRYCHCTAVSIAALLTAVVATAQTNPTDKQTADQLFEQAKESLGRGDWPGACEKFRQSQLLDPSASTLVKIARCREHDGRAKAALDTYGEALALLRASERQDAHALELTNLIRTAMETLESNLGHLNVHWTPSNVQVVLTIDGQAVDAARANAPLLLDPGQHTMALSAPGYYTEPQPFEVAKGETRELALELRPLPAPSSVVSQPLVRTIAPTPPPAPARAPIDTAPSAGSKRPKAVPSGRTQRTVAFLSGGVGSIMLGVAAYLGLRSRSLVDDAKVGHCDTSRSTYVCDPDGMSKLDEAERKETQAIVLGVGGVLFLGTGVVLLATAPSEPRHSVESKLALRLGPSGAWLGGSF